MQTPCHGCTRREVGCHGKCADYLAWREERDKLNEERQAERDVNQAIISSIQKTRRSIYRRSRTNKY